MSIRFVFKKNDYYILKEGETWANENCIKIGFDRWAVSRKLKGIKGWLGVHKYFGSLDKGLNGKWRDGTWGDVTEEEQKQIQDKLDELNGDK